MSIESAKKFIERMKADEVFAKNIIACDGAEARMELAVAEGYHFTSFELDQVGAQLSDEELDAVAGGLSYYACMVGIEGS